MQLTPFLSENLEAFRTVDKLAQQYHKLPTEILNLPHDEYELNVRIQNALRNIPLDDSDDDDDDEDSPLIKSKELLAEEERIRIERGG